ncbi:MAG: gamma-glutamyltransferase [Halieaceae bacterium]|jgi:gamma-glutamyltranspeptidase/glutathione hydrolase|nr:gamma-glutamyltransferase [Halieaceae bacterium]
MLMRALIFITVFVFATRGWAGTAALAMPDRWSAEVAQAVLMDGGNAVDAAIAATFMLAVTLPDAGNIGGGGFMTAYMDDEAVFLDFRERAPAKAYRDMFLDEGGNFQQRLSLVGGKASGVPGTVRGMQEAHSRYGTLPWRRLLAPAIGIARDGFAVSETMFELAVEKIAEDAGETNFHRYFGRMQKGEIFKQAELAATLELLAQDPDAFYSGVPARQLVAQMEATGGQISLSDLETYKAIWREPLRDNWREFEVLSAPPPSSGGFALVQLLKLREFSDQYFSGLWHNEARYVHLMAELEKRVYADRAEYLGDPDYVAVPMDRLLEDDYLRARVSSVNPEAISPIETVSAGLESTETTHFSIIDAEGNAVSLTTTLNWDFGSGVVVEGAGFLLNNQMDDFSAKVGVPNKFGVVGNDRNAIVPGKRMLSSMSPTILLRDGEPALVIGTSGGSTIITTVFQVILNMQDFDMPLQEAVDALRFHHQLPQALLIRHDQREVPVATRKGLEKLGYAVEENSWGNLGKVHAISAENGKLTAVSDIRAQGEGRVIEIPESAPN